MKHVLLRMRGAISKATELTGFCGGVGGEVMVVVLCWRRIVQDMAICLHENLVGKDGGR
jgi:hypothetical protein